MRVLTHSQIVHLARTSHRAWTPELDASGPCHDSPLVAIICPNVRSVRPRSAAATLEAPRPRAPGGRGADGRIRSRVTAQGRCGSDQAEALLAYSEKLARVRLRGNWFPTTVPTAGRAAGDFHNRTARNLACRYVEVDELWTK